MFSEDERTEFKRTTAELNEAIIDIVAILNKHGSGSLYFGLKNDGSPFTFTITDSTIRDVSSKIYESIKPQIYPDVHKAVLNGGEVIAVDFSGNDLPYSAFGRYYERVADESREMTPTELRRVMISREYAENWEKRQSDVLASEADDKTLRDFFNKAISCGRMPDMPYEKIALLKKLGLTSSDYLNNAGKLLFSADNPIVLKAAVFATDEKITFLDIERFEGNIFTLIEKAMKYISANIRWRVEINGLQRSEIPEIPLDALREIIINSFAHAKYDCPVQHEIDIFSNRVAITNPGCFANEHTPEIYARENYASVLRNELIAKTLYLCKDVESFGSGFKKIYTLCREMNVATNYRQDSNSFTFEFLRYDINLVSESKLAKSTPEKKKNFTELHSIFLRKKGIL